MITQPHPGGRPKGTPKTGGRKKGTPNKSTAERREKINEIIDFMLDNAVKYISKLNEKEKLTFLLNLMSYSMAKVAPVEAASLEPKENKGPKQVRLNLC